MPESVRKLVLSLLFGLAPAIAAAQDYYQTRGATSYGSARSATGETLVITRISPTFRVPVRTTPEQPVDRVEVRGYRDMYCAPLAHAERRAASETPEGDQGASQFIRSEGELNFRELLYARLAALDSAAMQAALQRAADTTDRAAQYRELFGVNLPAIAAEFSSWEDASLDAAAQMRLNTGQETAVAFSILCATPSVVDAAIAEARRVYAAVIAAMGGGGGRGLQPASGVQLQTPKGK